MSVRRLADQSEQPPSFAFSRVNRDWAQQTIQKYPKGREQSAVIPLMMRAQEQEGWLTKAAIETIADMLGMPRIRALEVATFYTQFQLKPVGSRAHVQVCGTTPCMLRGAEALMDVCRKRIHPEQFHTNERGMLSWEEVECLGACVNAPMVMIYKDTYEDLTPERLEEIIDQFAIGKGPAVPVGPQNGRTVSAPQSGLTSLKHEQAILKVTRDSGAGAARGEETPADAKADGAEVPPSKAAKPQTYAPETNGTLKTPSPEKTSPASEKATSASPPAFDAAAANKTEPAVEGEARPRTSPSAQSQQVAVGFAGAASRRADRRRRQEAGKDAQAGARRSEPTGRDRETRGG